MPKIEYRFDIAAVLLASVLTVVGFSAAEAGRKGGGNTGEFREGAGHAGDFRANNAATIGERRDGVGLRGARAKARAAHGSMQRAVEDWPPPPTQNGGAAGGVTSDGR